jgi:hypothetical protein
MSKSKRFLGLILLLAVLIAGLLIIPGAAQDILLTGTNQDTASLQVAHSILANSTADSANVLNVLSSHPESRGDGNVMRSLGDSQSPNAPAVKPRQPTYQSTVRPLDWELSITGDHNRGEWFTFTHTLGPDPQSLHPVKVYSQDYETLWGVGKYVGAFDEGSSFLEMFGDGSDGVLTVLTDMTDSPIDSSCSGISGTNILTATNPEFEAGQRIMIHQTRGVHSGTYQITRIQAYVSGTITTTDDLVTSYNSVGNNKAQVLVLKQYSDVMIETGVSWMAKAWDGETGGILAFYANGTVIISGTVTAAGRGFRGGAQTNAPAPDCDVYGSTYGHQGEGTAGDGGGNTALRNGNGGGGGVECNYNGGGGGGHGSEGGYGYGDVAEGGVIVGDAFLTTVNFGGGGGGAAPGGDGGENGLAGGNGGGIIRISAHNVLVGGDLLANGDAGGGSPDHYGGGGGAGGSIFIKAQTATLGHNQVLATGGAGGGPNRPGGNGGIGRIRVEYCDILSGSTTPSASTEKLDCSTWIGNGTNVICGKSFQEFQSIPTNGAEDWEYFTIGTDHYLAVANLSNGSTYNIDSKIYQWDGASFVEFQSIPTNGATDWEFFTIDADHYLAVAYYYNDSTYNFDSKIYRWNGANFVEFQSIPTNCAEDWEFFTIGSNHYLAVANSFDGSSFNIDSKLYQWSGTNFVEFQSIPTSQASDWEFFTIGSDHYLAVGNHSDGSAVNVDSKLYRWNGINFVEFQSIATSGGNDWEFFTIGSDYYLAVANYGNDSAYNINSKLYRWNGTNFVEFQSIFTSGARNWKKFTIDSDDYLAVANQRDNSVNYNTNSKLYQWDGTSFAEFQLVPTNGAYDWEFFTIDGDHYLAVANFSNNSTYNIDSKILLNLTCCIVEQIEAAPYTAARLNLPEDFTGGRTYQVQYGRRLFLLASEIVTTTLRVPAREFDNVTLDALVSGVGDGPITFTLDIGGDDSWDWLVTRNVTHSASLASPNLAAAFNRYWAAQGAPMSGTLDVPVRVSLDKSGQVILTNLVMTRQGLPAANVTINGPDTGGDNVSYFFTATASPITLTTPITYVWQATDLLPVTHVNRLGDTVILTWPTTGTKTLSVTAINRNGKTLNDSHVINIRENTPPQIVTATISPASPTGDNDNLELDYIYHDPDSDPEGDTLVRWSRVQQLQPDFNDQNSISGDVTLPGEVWCAAVTPHDGLEYGELVEVCANVVFAPNAAPQALNVIISPPTPNEYSGLELSYNYSDAENDPEDTAKTQLRWYRNGMLQPAFNNQDSISSGDTYPGETWCATVQPHDGYQYGAPGDSNCVLVASSGNRIPQALDPTIAPVEPESNDTLELTYVYTDVDGDLEGNSLMRWYRNGVLQPFFNDRSYVSPDYTLWDDEWRATIRPHDGQDYGLPVEAEPVLVNESTANSPPRAINVRVIPSQPGDGDHLHLHYTYLDPDGDPEGNTMVLWLKVEGDQVVLQEEYDGQTVVPSSATTISETWFAKVVPHDGHEYGLVAAAHSVTVGEEPGNTPPQTHNVYLIPASPGLEDSLELHYEYDDADGDPEGATEIQWTRDGYIQHGFTGQTLIPSGATEVGQTWCATVTPHDGLEPGEPTTSNCVVITDTPINSPPEARDVYIQPNRPRSDQDLELHYVYFDPENDPGGNTQIRWFMNGVLQNEFSNLTTVPAATTKPGQRWSATVVPHDGLISGTLVSAPVVTVNSPPQVQEVEISPAQPQEHDILVLNYDYDDADGDMLNFLQVLWHRNGEHQPTYDGRRHLPASATSVGERWFAAVTAHDGFEYGQVIASNIVTIAAGPVVIHDIYLPLVLRNYETESLLDEYYEDNDTQDQAYPLNFGRVYQAYPDDQDDWYYVFLDQTSFLDVQVENYVALGQLVVYEPDPGNDPPRRVIANDGRGLPTMALPNEDFAEALTHLPEAEPGTGLPPGRYYIRIYSSGDFSSEQLYRLITAYEPR